MTEYQFNWSRHEDLSLNRTRLRQIETARALKLAGLSDYVQTEGQNPSLARPYCQWAAAARRARWEAAALKQLEADFDQGVILLAVTVVFPRGVSHDVSDVLPEGDVERINHVFRRALAREPALIRFIGAIEVDYCLKDGARYWQRTAHVCAVIRAHSVAAAKRKVRSAIGLESSSLARRPVVSHEVSDAPNWIRYCFKGQSFGSTGASHPTPLTAPPAGKRAPASSAYRLRNAALCLRP